MRRKRKSKRTREATEAVDLTIIRSCRWSDGKDLKRARRRKALSIRSAAMPLRPLSQSVADAAAETAERQHCKDLRARGTSAKDTPTTAKSMTLYQSQMYLTGPKAETLSNISTTKKAVNVRVAISWPA